MNRSLLAIGSCLWTGVLSMWVGACDLTGDGSSCGYGPSSEPAFIGLLCVPASPPTIQVSGACTAAQVTPTEIDVQSGEIDGGTCQVELTFAGGVTAAVSVTFLARSGPCGACYCDPYLVPERATTSVGSQCADSGVDAGDAQQE